MDTIIKSTKNPLIKDLKRLNNAKDRAETGRFLVEGIKCMREALAIDNMCEMILISEADETVYDEIKKVYDGEIIRVSDIALQAISAVKTPQSVIGVCNRANLLKTHKSGLIVVLDSISDPGNLGAVIRTADAVNAAAIYTVNHCTDFLSPKVIRASMGSIFHVPIFNAVIADITALKAGGYHVLGADIRGTTEFIIEEEKLVLVIGNEAHGISDEVDAIIDKKIKIPIYGKAESLNAAVAASILMYKLVGY